MDLLPIRQIGLHIFVFVDKVCDVLDGQALVLWDGYVPHLVPVDRLLRAADQVLQEVDRHLLVRRKVDVGVNGEEVVALTLATVLGSEGSR